MAEMLSWFSLATSICAILLAVLSAVASLRVGSRFSSMGKRWTASAASVESFESRLKTLEERYGSVAKREHLNARRDPVTGRSLPKEPETKDQLRNKLGLVGAGAARAAFEIHSRGGLKQ